MQQLSAALLQHASEGSQTCTRDFNGQYVHNLLPPTGRTLAGIYYTADQIILYNT